MGRFLSMLNRIIWILVFVLGVIAGALWVYLYTQMGMTPQLSYTARLLKLVIIVIALIPIIAFVHEMGHAIAAWMVGYRVHFIAVMRLGFAPETGRFHWVRTKEYYELGGFVQYTTGWFQDHKWKDIFVLSAGVLACCLLALIIYAFDLFGWYGGRMSLYVALGIVAASLPNFIPFMWGKAVATDGKQILDRLRGGKWSAEVWATNRAWAAQNGFTKQVMSEAEWASVRNLDFTQQSDYMCYLARKFAWERTDIQAYSRIYAQSSDRVLDMDPDIGYQDLVMQLLAGLNLDPKLKADFEAKDVTEDSSIIMHFANVLFAHHHRSPEAAKAAVDAARRRYIAVMEQVAPEEEAIFSAVEKGGPLPKMI